MPRVDFYELADKLTVAKNFSKGIHIILCDDALLPYLIKKTFPTAKTFEGKQAITEFVDELSQESLFGEKNPAIVYLSEKLTATQWSAATTELERIPNPGMVMPSFLIASAGLRNTIKEPALKNLATVWLSYQPSEMDAVKTMRVLVNLFSNPPANATQSASTIQPANATQLANALAAHYGTDFLAALLHLERMEKGGLRFEEAVLAQTEADAFQVIDALIRGDSAGLHLRLSQCQASGIDAASIFGSLGYFFKQLVAVQAALEDGAALKQAFDEKRIPFPAQARLQQAVRRLPVEKVLAFFRNAAANELALRKSKNAFDLLAIELAALIA